MRRTILVIDRNAAVLELAEQVLRAAGHHVLVTSDPYEALAVTHTLRVDLVVGDATDLEPFRRKADGPPLLPIGDDGALSRPYSLDELADAVERVLD